MEGVSNGIKPLIQGIRTCPWLCGAFTCYWIWFIVTQLGPLRFNLSGWIDASIPSWLLCLVAEALSFFVLYLVERLLGRVDIHVRMQPLACGLFFVGLLLSTIWLEMPIDAAIARLVYVAGALLMGVGASFVLLVLVDYYARLGLSVVLVHGLCAMLCATLVQLALVWLNTSLLIMVVSLCIPFLIYVCIRNSRGIPARQVLNDAAGHARFMRPVLPTFFVQGLAFGFGIGILGYWGVDFALQKSVSSLCSGVASLILLVTAITFKANFTRLIYYFGFPAMATGFLFMSLSERFLAFGDIVQACGFCYQFMVSICLLVFLAKTLELPVVHIGAPPLCALCFGQVLGGCFGSFVVPGESIVAVDIRSAASLMCFVLLMAALFFSGLIRGSVGWGTARLGNALYGEFDEIGSAARTLAALRGLTPRETDVLALAAHGYNKRSIGRDLCISEQTAKTHLKSIYQKLDVHSNQELIDEVHRHMGARD